MNVRILVAALVAAVVVFVWGAVGWAGGLYSFGFKPMPAGNDLAAQLAASVPESAGYYYPPLPDTLGMTPQQAELAMQEANERYRTGPIMLALVHKGGVDPQSPTIFLRGFAIEFFACAVLAAIMGIAAKFGARTQDRVALALALAAFVVLGVHGVMWNFMHIPDSFSIAMAIDGFVGWSLAGLVCALIVRPRRS